MSKVKTIFIIVLITCGYSNVNAGIMGSVFGYDNRWECILDRMPGSKRDRQAELIYRGCARDAPTRKVYERETVWPFFGIQNAGECVKEKVESGSRGKATMYITTACYLLYKR